MMAASLKILTLFALIGITTYANDNGLGKAQQYTPNQANWKTFETKPFVGGTNTAHDPDGIGWIKRDQWDAAKWDGTVYDPTKMTKKQFAVAICPGVDRIRGLREVFYKHKPFANNKNPTRAVGRRAQVYESVGFKISRQARLSGRALPWC